jgi:hypothetical protein
VSAWLHRQVTASNLTCAQLARLIAVDGKTVRGDEVEFGNARTAWLRLLRPTAHWAGGVARRNGGRSARWPYQR